MPNFYQQIYKTYLLCFVLAVQPANLIFANIELQPDLARIAKFNDRQYFRIYGIYCMYVHASDKGGNLPFWICETDVHNISVANASLYKDHHFLVLHIKTCTHMYEHINIYTHMYEHINICTHMHVHINIRIYI